MLRYDEHCVVGTWSQRCIDGTRRDVWVPVKNAEQAHFVAEAIALSYGVPCIEESR